MGTVKGLRIGYAAGIVAGLTILVATAALSQEERFTTERPASILIFPKVINTTGGRTTIQITNTSNMLVHAHCFYVNGQTLNGIPVWQVTDFEIALTRQQPTFWSGGDGRPVDPGDGITGIDPGSVPPLPPGFTGGLVCVQTNPDGGTNGDANALKGEATVSQDNETAQLVGVSKYNAVGIQGIDDDGDNVLNLDNAEFAGCPLGAHLNFVPEGAEDDIINRLGNGPSAVSTTLALMPCDMDFENLIPGNTSLGFQFRDEFETGNSLTPVLVDCWNEFNLDAASIDPAMASTYWYARITSTETSPGGGGFVGVANVQRIGLNGAIATSATNLHYLGNTATGFCSADDTTVCSSDLQCAGGGGTCVKNLGNGAIVAGVCTAGTCTAGRVGESCAVSGDCTTRPSAVIRLPASLDRQE